MVAISLQCLHDVWPDMSGRTGYEDPHRVLPVGRSVFMDDRGRLTHIVSRHLMVGNSTASSGFIKPHHTNTEFIKLCGERGGPAELVANSKVHNVCFDDVEIDGEPRNVT